MNDSETMAKLELAKLEKEQKWEAECERDHEYQKREVPEEPRSKKQQTGRPWKQKQLPTKES